MLSERRRAIFTLLLAAASFAIIGDTLLIQHFLHDKPCELCVLQRVAMLALGGALLLSALAHFLGRGRGLGHVVVGLSAVAGAGVAARHIALQLMPPAVAHACSISLYNMMGSSSYHGFWHALLYGSGDCAKVVKLLGVSIPIWSLSAFVLMGTIYTAIHRWGIRAAVPTQRPD